MMFRLTNLYINQLSLSFKSSKFSPLSCHLAKSFSQNSSPGGDQSASQAGSSSSSSSSQESEKDGSSSQSSTDQTSDQSPKEEFKPKLTKETRDWLRFYRDPTKSSGEDYIRDVYDAYKPTVGGSEDIRQMMKEQGGKDGMYRHPQFMAWQVDDSIGMKRMGNMFKDEIGRYKAGDFRKVDNRMFPSHADVAVIGGGIMGASIAHWLMARNPHNLHVVVLERDPTVS